MVGFRVAFLGGVGWECGGAAWVKAGQMGWDGLEGREVAPKGQWE